MKSKTNVAVLTGGHAAEREISLASAKVVASNLDSRLYDIYTVDISSTPWPVKMGEEQIGAINLNDFTCTTATKQIHFDVVFMVIHGTPAEDGKLQGYFDVMGIPYTCCSALASAITFDKDICKQLLTNQKCKLAKSVLLRHRKITDQNQTSLKNLQLPLFVKPNKNGSSYGVSKVNVASNLQAAIEKAFEFDDEVLVEEFIEGRELGCGVFEQNGDVIALPITEIISENEFFDYEAKYLGKSKEITPADLTQDVVKELNEVSVSVYRQLKLSGACRIDFFLTNNGVYLLEVNAIPGFSAESILPQQAKAAGYTLTEFFGIIVEETLRKAST